MPYTPTGRRRLLTIENPGQVQPWIIDGLHRVRAALAMRADKASGKARCQTWWRESDESPWQLLTEHLMDEPGFYLAAIDADGCCMSSDARAR
jgi:hypothetical protein